MVLVGLKIFLNVGGTNGETASQVAARMVRMVKKNTPSKETSNEE